MRLSTLTLLVVAMASPAVANDVVVTGTLSAEKGKVQITSGKTVYDVSGEQLSTLLLIANSNPTQTPRTVTVEGEAASTIGASGKLTRTLDVYAMTSPRSVTVQGVASSHGGKTTLALETQDGKPTHKHLTLTGVPSHLLAQLDQRRVVLAGWRFGDELQLTSAQAKVTKDGWLSEKRFADGKWQYRSVAEVSTGQPVRVLELAAYDKVNKVWRPLSEMKDGDLLFAKVGAGRPRGDGGYPFVGWMPVFKMSFGEKVEAQPEQQSIDNMPPQGGADGITKKIKKVEKAQ